MDGEVAEMIKERIESDIAEGNRQTQVSEEAGRPEVEDSFRVEMADNRVVADRRPVIKME